MNDKEEISLYDLNIEELWLTLKKTLEENNLTKEYEQEHEKIKNGYKLRVDIRYLFENKGWYEEYPTSKKVRIQGHGKYPLIPFLDEIDTRKIAMIKIIEENQEEKGITTPRGTR